MTNKCNKSAAHVLVVGYGSIGARHARLLDEMECKVACVTHNPGCPFTAFTELEKALHEWAPERIVVANPTADHASVLGLLENARYQCPILMEKPLFHTGAVVQGRPSMPIFVAYNLRFHPVITELRKILTGQPLFSAEFHAGQFLADWRPGRDYLESYSARPEQGGGVLRDLSHELDLALWFCGTPREVSAFGGTFGDLGIASDDIFSFLMSTERCRLVTLTVNYLDRIPQRNMLFNLSGKTVLANLVEGTLNVNGEIQSFKVERDTTYKAELRAFLDGDGETLCSYDEGLAVVRLIDLAEHNNFSKARQSS